MKIFISNRKETKEQLNDIYRELFNENANAEKIRKFELLCEKAYNFFPSERCKGKKCVLGKSSGNLDSKIMFIAEAPGRNGAERTGIPIYGDPSGDNFERILLQSTDNTIGRKDVYITNSFLWNPTLNGNNDRPTDEEINSALPFLIEQIEIVNPELIIVLGLTAYQTIGKISPLPMDKISIKEVTGKVFKWNNRLLGIMYHPSPRVVGVYRSLDEMSYDLKNILKNYIRMRQK